MLCQRFAAACGFALLTISSFAATLGGVRGVVHDPQHRPVENAMVMLRSKTSDWATTANTDATGQFTFNAVTMGEYSVTIVAPNFNQAMQNVVLSSGSQPVLHFSQPLDEQRNGECLRLAGSCAH